MPSSSSITAGSRRQTGRRKVKSGCRTCKVRKVKCDELFPACFRCISTGRVCDGYGIWGGGSISCVNTRRPRVGASCQDPVPPHPASVSLFVASPEEKQLLHWFELRTSTKLPGSFFSDFWSALLLQASHGEPAIFHAVLALSSVHRGRILDSDSDERDNSIPDRLEQVTIHHYLKAISHLQPYLSGKDRSSCRVALIACFAFISLDLLRAHFNAAQAHLYNGLKLLQETYGPLGGSTTVIDEWIIEVFARMHVQAGLFNQTSQYQPLVLHRCEPGNRPSVFCSFKDAWQELQRLLNNVLSLGHRARGFLSENKLEVTGYVCPAVLVEEQQKISKELAQWLDIYTASRASGTGRDFFSETRVWLLLQSYHTMTAIMTEVCLHPDDEMIFDTHSHLFVRLIRQLADLWTASAADLPYPTPPGLSVDMSKSIVDMGWIAPLFYTATKCRVHRIRLQAIRLLECSSHREGFWDAKILSLVARRVVELEEEDFYAGVDIDDGFPLCGAPVEGDMSLEALPESYRIRGLEVVFCGDPFHTVLLRSKQRVGGEVLTMDIAQYQLSARRWLDANTVV